MTSPLFLGGLACLLLGILIQIIARGYFDWLFGSRRTSISSETYWIDIAGRAVAIVGLFMIVGYARTQ